MADTETSATHGRASDTREQILVVALRLFAEKGYDATSMREIAEELGISKPALYYHFDSKEDIVRGVLRETEDHVAELLTWARTRRPTAATRREALGRWADIVQRHGLAVFRFMLSNRAAIQAAHSDNKSGVLPQVRELCALLLPADADVSTQLRLRLALMTVNMAGAAGLDIEAPEEDLLATAREVALELLP